MGCVVDTIGCIVGSVACTVGSAISNPVVDTVAAIALGQPELALGDLGAAATVGDIASGAANAGIGSTLGDWTALSDLGSAAGTGIGTVGDVLSGASLPGAGMTVDASGNILNSVGDIIGTVSQAASNGISPSTFGNILKTGGSLLNALTPSASGLQNLFSSVGQIAPLAAAGGLGYLAYQCQQNINKTITDAYNNYLQKQNAIASGYGVKCGPQQSNYTVGGIPLSQAVQTPRTVAQTVVAPQKAKHGGIMSTRHHYELGGSTPIGPAQGSFLNNPNYQQRQASLLNQVRSNPQLAMLLKQKLMQTKQNAMPTGFRGGAQLNPLSQNLAHGGRAHYAMGTPSLPINQPQSNPFQDIAGGAVFTNSNGQMMNNQMGIPLAKGGLPNVRKNPHGVHEIDYRKTGGYVPPIGVKEKADDIPAMLSNNEFVFTADAVRKAGGGDVKEGAKKMYALMKHLEGK